MRSTMILLVTVGLAGCATHRPVAIVAPPVPDRALVREAAPTREVKTRYEVRSYFDAGDPALRHEAHAVYRRTRVPVRVEALETIPRLEFAPVSFAPLPPSSELAAELAAQKEITTELRAIKTAMAAMEIQAQNQYGVLVSQTAEAVKLRRQLEDERARVKELELAARLPQGDLLAPAPVAADPKW
jgi:hypothetical protein